jgi:hypothetical protein
MLARLTGLLIEHGAYLVETSPLKGFAVAHGLVPSAKTYRLK